MRKLKTDRIEGIKQQEALLAKQQADIKKSKLAREDKFSEARKAKEGVRKKEIEYSKLVAR